MIIVRYGEIGLKSQQTRRVMERRLVENLKKALDGKVVRRGHGRIFVESDSMEDARRIARVFGVVSTSIAVKTSSAMEELLKTGVEFAVKRLDRGKTFAVRARRKGSHPYKSTDVAVRLGAAIAQATGAKVDLENPDVTIHVEVRDRDAYIFDEVIAGVGGLPLGTQGRAIALVSGGIDSPVAAWMMMRRGVEVTPLFMDCRPLVDDRTIERAKKTIEVLSSWANAPLKTYVVPYGDALMSFLKYGDHRLGCVLCKRMMLRIASQVAMDTGARALVTGENLGQVASQTLDNIAAIEQGIEVPVLRPLIAMDKNEIVELAREIGTYEASIAPANCCLGPPLHPETRATSTMIARAEEELGMEGLVEKARKDAWVMEVGCGEG